MAQVVMRAISCRLSVRTTLTSLATISPCRLKFTTTTLLPSGVTCAVAGKLPSMTCPAYALLRVSNFQSTPYGVPCAVVT